MKPRTLPQNGGEKGLRSKPNGLRRSRGGSNEIAHVIRCLERNGAAGAGTIEIEDQPYRRFIARVHKRMKYAVWQGCHGCYFDEKGQDTTNWPNFSIYYSCFYRRRAFSACHLEDRDANRRQ